MKAFGGQGSRRSGLLGTVGLVAASMAAIAAHAAPDPLAAEFAKPPPTARPGAWWHWLNGNITRAGLEEDLEWMKRVGLGSVQAFDASQDTPQIVDQRLAYMSPGWKDVFRDAVQKADALGLEFGVASSAGWSETGGPWVKPEQAMKKLVWSKVQIEGGKPFRGSLPPLPAITGPYQDIPAAAVGTLRVDGFARDVAVLAYRTDAGPEPSPAGASANSAPIDVAALADAGRNDGVPLPPNRADGPGVIEIDYAAPQTIRTAVVNFAHLPSNSLAGALNPALEVSEDGKSWRRVTQITLTPTPTTVSFAPVTGTRFRLVLTRGKARDVSHVAIAPGIDMAAAGGFSKGMKVEPRLVEFRLLTEARVNAFEQKAGFALADDYYALDKDVGDDAKGVSPGSVVDLTGRMRPDGQFDWTPPAGRWTILRLGYSLTGKTNAPGTAEATGLEVDKYDATAVADYMEHYLAGLRQVVGDGLIGAHGIRALTMDSIEAGPSNWTPRLVEQFRRLRGYDPTPWLPALTGVIVGSRAPSDGFLYDYRRTLADLIASEHYGTVAKVAHGDGLFVYAESLEGGRAPYATLGDDLEMRRFADAPMAALWTYPSGRPDPAYLADMRGAASTAHIYGRRYVAAESLTSILAPWAYGPADLQPMIDTEFLSGINRPMIHDVVLQPRDDRTPGLSLGVYGQQFGRHETWAEMARPWIDYIARNSFLLQQGRNVADVGYFYGEEEPIGVMGRDAYPRDVPKRYAYDFVPPDAVLHELSVAGGEIVSRGGARYKALYLGGSSSKMTLPVLRSLAALAEGGGVLVGQPPQSTPSLADDPKEFAALVHRLWGGGAVTHVGEGRVFSCADVEAALAASGVAPDFSYAAGEPDADVQFVHHVLRDGDLYLVSNRKARPEQLEARFRVAGKAPEIWRADTGATEPVSYRLVGGQTVVPLDMRANESFFVVFRRPAAALSHTIVRRAPAPVGEVAGPWRVAFQAGRGAPPAVELATLGSLSAQADPGVKYFSGVATYTTRFTLPKVRRGAPLLLDLGKVGDVAEVRVNGKAAGTAWKAPYRVQIGSFVHSGQNVLEVKVADLWVNRLIGDQQPGAQRITFTSGKTYTAQAPLRPSGLIGPVTLLSPAPP